MSWGALQSESLEGDEVGAGSGDRGGSVYERSDQMRASPSGLVSDSDLENVPSLDLAYIKNLLEQSS